MLPCSNSVCRLLETPAATIDDILSVASVGEPSFDGSLRAVGALKSHEPSLAFLTLADGEIIVLTGDNEGDGLRDAQTVLERLPKPAPGQTSSVQAAIRGEQQTAVAVSLPLVDGDVVLVCLVGTGAGQRWTDTGPGNDALKIVAALGLLLAANKAERMTMLAEVEQLAAGHQALEASYARSLARAVAERDERLQEQREHTSRLQAVMMTAAEGIVTIDASGSIESFYAAATAIFGYSPEEVVGSNVALLFSHGQDAGSQAPCACLLGEDRGNRHANVQEILGRRKDGTIFPLEMAISDVALQDRVIVTAILRDITERKASERELKRLHLFNRMVLDSAGEGIVGLDRDGNVVFANPVAEQLLGRTSNEMVGLSLHRLTHHSRQNSTAYSWYDCPVCRTLSEGTIYREDSEVFWRSDGKSFPVEYVATPMREEGGIVGAVLTFQDITQRRNLEGQLVQAQKLESIGQLAAGIAHEINTPTQFIGDNLRFLEEAFRDLAPVLADLRRGECRAASSSAAAGASGETPPTDIDSVQYLIEEIPRAVSQSLEGVERVAKIVRSMKDFSHPGNDEMQSVDLNRAIESTLTVCRNEWKYVADVTTDFDPDLPPVVCLPGECNQVFLNLIINASHAIGEALKERASGKGTITVSTKGVGKWVEIRIADTGTGIPAEARTKVFDPFFTTKEVGRGTGQGLAIARSVIVDKHGGSLTFETEIGRGTTFIVRLPCDRQ